VDSGLDHRKAQTTPSSIAIARFMKRMEPANGTSIVFSETIFVGDSQFTFARSDKIHTLFRLRIEIASFSVKSA
jgi:hypothetical protein